MELWVRSQNKVILQKTNALFIAHSEENIWSIIDNQNMTKYGEYKTRERALEVLDEIQNILKPIIKINYEYDDSQPIMNGEWLKSLKEESKIEELSTYVYEMPED